MFNLITEVCSWKYSRPAVQSLNRCQPHNTKSIITFTTSFESLISLLLFVAEFGKKESVYVFEETLIDYCLYIFVRFQHTSFSGTIFKVSTYIVEKVETQYDYFLLKTLKGWNCPIHYVNLSSTFKCNKWFLLSMGDVPQGARRKTLANSVPRLIRNTFE